MHAAANVVDETGTGSTADVTYKVLDATGAVVAHGDVDGRRARQHGRHGRAQDITVDNPHLWSTDTPYLYTLETDVSEGGMPVDSGTTTFGIRWITIDPNGGVSINGKHIKLQGVDLHNDEGALGSVDNYDALWRQMSILKSEGVNCVPHLAQPAVAGDGRRLPAARHRDDGRGVRRVGEPAGRSRRTTTCTSTSGATTTSRRWSTSRRTRRP